MCRFVWNSGARYCTCRWGECMESTLKREGVIWKSDWAPWFVFRFAKPTRRYPHIFPLYLYFILWNQFNFFSAAGNAVLLQSYIFGDSRKDKCHKNLLLQILFQAPKERQLLWLEAVHILQANIMGAWMCCRITVIISAPVHQHIMISLFDLIVGNAISPVHGYCRRRKMMSARS